VAGAVGVATGEGGREGVLVGDVAAEHWVQVVGFVVWETVWDEDGELVGRVGV